MNFEYDLLVIGGGINGAGIAADAAGRGLKVLLCEQDDLASATSSSSSKLIHGGLRYLEHNEFSLVRKALAEREVLLKKAPHIIWPLRFCLPHRPHLRPAWLIRLGLFLYDHLASRVTLPGSKTVKLGKSDPLSDDINKGFEYSDAWVDDARLVVLNALAAEQHGADIRTRSRCIQAKRIQGGWQAELESVWDKSKQTVTAKAVVNAAGPWVQSLFSDVLQQSAPKQIRLVKGSHIIVPKIHQSDKAYILQNEDGRIVFVLPYEDKFSLIGTTDVEFAGDPSKAEISLREVDYLLEITNAHFKQQINRQHVLSSFSGVRPLLDDGTSEAQQVTRDYVLTLDEQDGQAPLLAVFGGKITTYRQLAEQAVDKLGQYFPQMKSCTTAQEVLPGGDFDSHTELQQRLAADFVWLPETIRNRYVRTYGSLSYELLQTSQKLADLGRDFGAGLYQLEVDYLLRQEWACTAEDILWRRTKLGLQLNPEQQTELRLYLSAEPQLQKSA